MIATSERIPSDNCCVKIQISLRICTVWSDSSLDAFWIAKDTKFLHAYNKRQRLRSDGLDVQADLSLRCLHMLEGMFSHVAAQTSVAFRQ